MQLPMILQGRPFGPEALAQVQALLEQPADWSRYRLSRELARRWEWRAPARPNHLRVPQLILA